MDPLVEIKPTNWCKWEDYFQKHLPFTVPGYSLLKMQKFWLEKNKSSSMTFYAPFGNTTAGLVAINLKGLTTEVIIIAIEDGMEQLERSLLETKLIDWQTDINIPYAANNVLRMMNEKIIPKLCIVEASFVPCFLFCIDKDSIKSELNLPAGLVIKGLKIEHAQIANELFPHKYPGSEQHFSALISSGLGYGVFKDNELVCFGFVNENGFMNHLYTLEKNRKTNYAKWLAMYMIKLQDKYAHSFVLIDNLTSIKFHINLGGDVFGIHTWIFLKPKNLLGKL